MPSPRLLDPRSPQADPDWGAFALHRQRTWKRPRRRCESLSSTPEPSAGEPQDEPVCPAAFTVVWLTVGLLVVVVVVGGGPLTHEGSGGRDLMFWWMYSSHWTSAILQSHLKKLITLIFLFFFLSYFVPLQEFHRSKVAANKLHVVFRIVDRAQTGFAFFAVTFEDLCNHSCRGPTVTGVFLSQESVEWRRGWEFELEKHCREWFLSGRLVYMTRLI